MKKPPSN
ncbi:hypothetical protein D048_4621A, partial [Vibrio parahaemolyticus VPTS-2009]